MQEAPSVRSKETPIRGQGRRGQTRPFSQCSFSHLRCDDSFLLAAPPSVTWLRRPLSPPCTHYRELICLHGCAESGQTPVNSPLLCKTASSLRADPSGSDGRESTCNAGDPVQSVPGSGRSPGGEHVSPLQCSWLENLMDRGAWQVHEVTKRRTRLSN